MWHYQSESISGVSLSKGEAREASSLHIIVSPVNQPDGTYMRTGSIPTAKIGQNMKNAPYLVHRTFL